MANRCFLCHKNEENRVKWMASKDGDFPVKSLYRTMQPGSLAFFPSKIIWNSCVQPKLSLFCVGGFLGESSNLGSSAKERLGYGK